MNLLSGTSGIKIHAPGGTPAWTLCGLKADEGIGGRVTCRRCKRSLKAIAEGRPVAYQGHHRNLAAA